jgi:hypothetical protein
MSDFKFVIQKKKKKNSILDLLGRKKSSLKKNIFPNENVDHVITKKNICCGERFSTAQLLHRRNKYFRTKNVEFTTSTP